MKNERPDGQPILILATAGQKGVSLPH